MLSQVRPINKSFCLQMLCEENYRKLFKLIPNLEANKKHSNSVQAEILATGPYTYTVLLSGDGVEKKPSFKCRVYLDTQSVEVITIESDTPPIHQQDTSPKDVLNNKWGINYFFEKWLIFQLQLSNTTQITPRTISA